MRFFKVFLIVLVFFLSMIFFVQNNQVLSQTMSLELNLFVKTWRSIPLPFYFLVLASFVAGAIFCLAYFLIEKMRLTRELKQCRSRLASLEQEVNSLRNLPLAENGYPGIDETSQGA
ncbi:MAG: LapA family protein [Desulfovibrionaceae bacterium]|jgi:putative membrane protein|nr:LapA family protein [Desulfovibrionaceae bacterium]